MRPITHSRGRTEGELTCLKFSHNAFAAPTLSLHHQLEEDGLLLSLFPRRRFEDFSFTLSEGSTFADTVKVLARRACDWGPVRRNLTKSNLREATDNSTCSMPPAVGFCRLPSLWHSDTSALSTASLFDATISLQSLVTDVFPTWLQASAIASKTNWKPAGWAQTQSWEFSPPFPISWFGFVVAEQLSTFCCSLSVSVEVQVSVVFCCLQRKETGARAPWGYCPGWYNTTCPCRVPFK